jgi:hypothetical protein
MSIKAAVLKPAGDSAPAAQVFRVRSRHEEIKFSCYYKIEVRAGGPEKLKKLVFLSAGMRTEGG